MAAKRLILHCGAHKTGTTTIQKCLAEIAGQLEARGIGFVPPAEINQAGLVSVLHSERNGLDEKRLGELIVEVFGRWLRRSKISCVLVSHESLLSFANMNAPVGDRTFYGDRRRSLRGLALLKTVFEDVTVVYYVRRQDRFLESVYLEYLRQGYFTEGFHEFLKAGTYERIHWLRVLEDIRDVFGSSSVVVKPFEEIKYGAEEFLRRYLAIVDAGAGWELPAITHENPSLSAVAYEVASRCYGVLKLEQRRAMSQFLRLQFPPESCGRVKLLTDRERLDLLAAFRKDNIELCERFFPEWKDHYVGRAA